MSSPVSIDLLADLIRGDGSATVRCAGDSMEPTVAKGSKVAIRRCDRPRSGDVVLFRSGEELLLHRVLWSSELLDRFAHVGDMPGARAGIGACSAVIGKADLPRTSPRLSQHWSGLRRVAEAVTARLRRGN